MAALVVIIIVFFSVFFAFLVAADAVSRATDSVRPDMGGFERIEKDSLDRVRQRIDLNGDTGAARFRAP